MSNNANINEQLTMYAGDTGPIKQIKFTDIDISGCTCQQALWRNLNDSAGAVYGPENVTETIPSSTGERFLVYLPQGSTTGFTAGGYVWVIELICNTSTPPLTKEVHIPLVVNSQGIV